VILKIFLKMNKLYLIGALALSANAAVTLVASAPATFTSATYSVYTNTATGDCYSAATATTLGMNNIYYQYYSFTIAAGTVTPTPAVTPVPAFTTTSYSPCYHEHLYNWMAQPQVGTPALLAGMGDALVAYGYAMTGASLTACAKDTIVDSIYSATTKIFTGAKYQHMTLTKSPGATTPTIADTSASVEAYITKTGAGSVYAVAGTITTYVNTPTPTVDGYVLSGTQNVWWDFL
jgi:hypothetical protein